MSTPWFFFSYARTDAGTEHLKTFYSDLVYEVRRKAGLHNDTPESHIGFMDTGISLGADWAQRLGNALHTCRTFICLYSPSYFKSPDCGKEFQVFNSRLDEYIRASGSKIERPNLIFPVLWDTPRIITKSLPPAVSGIEYINDSLGELYASKGLYILSKVRSQENVNAYNQFVLSFAELIVQEADPNRLPPSSPPRPFEQEKNAFQTVADEGAQGITATTRGGPNAAHFVYVAGSNSELGSVRRKVDCYGEDEKEWRPFHPGLEKPVWLISQSVATTEGLEYSRLCIDEDFIGRLREAEEKNVIVVIVVDPWSIQVESYKNKMTEFDRRDFLNCGILIPWNEQDEETCQSMHALQRGVQATFERKFFLNPTYFRGSIRSPEELQKQICDTINEVRARLIKRAEIKSPLAGGGGQMPLLSNAAVEQPSPTSEP